MNPITYRFTLDLAKSGVQYVLSGIKTGDTNRVMEIHLTVNGTPYEIKPGTSARIRAVSGNAVVDGLCEIKGNMIRYEIPPSMLVAEGQVYADIEIGDEAGEKFATCEILMLVYKDLFGDEKTPETEFNSLIQAIAIAEGKAINNVTVKETGALLIHLNDETEIDAGYVSPRIQINGATNEWEISYDGGETWENTGVRATGDVSEAVSKAETAANLANDKAEKANDAAESASQAAAEARTAKDEALTAKDRADSAASYANQTAYRAQIAAQDATQATANASQAATNAENSIIIEANVDERNGDLILKRKNGREINAGKVKGEPDYSLVANALKGKKSGEVVALTDVSPLEHEMKVGLKSDTLTDFSTVTLKKYGKNLFNINAEYITEGQTYYRYDFYLKPNTAYTVSSDVPQTTAANIYANGTSSGASGVYVGIPRTVTTDAKGYMYVRVRFAGQDGIDATGVYTELKNGTYFLQIEEGATATEYEPYKEPITYTADENGKVNGIIGNGESMTLVSDTAGVTIEAEYNRDTNKVIANLMEKIAALENAAAGLI